MAKDKGKKEVKKPKQSKVTAGHTPLKLGAERASGQPGTGH